MHFYFGILMMDLISIAGSWEEQKICLCGSTHLKSEEKHKTLTGEDSCKCIRHHLMLNRVKSGNTFQQWSINSLQHKLHVSGSSARLNLLFTLSTSWASHISKWWLWQWPFIKVFQTAHALKLKCTQHKTNVDSHDYFPAGFTPWVQLRLFDKSVNKCLIDNVFLSYQFS